MYLLASLVAGGLGWFLFRRWRRRLSVDPRLTLPFWRNSLLVVGAYLLSILLGAGITRLMIGFNRSGWAELLLVGFFTLWVLYGAIWLQRLLPSTRPRPAWLARWGYWIDGLCVALLFILAAAARLV